MNFFSISFLRNLIGVLCLAYISLAIVGGFIHYSPVPFWDMLDGYLDFYVNASSGNWGAWWAQHNEHRILLSRVLFWLDIHLFNGSMIFLIVANFLLMLLSFITFQKISAIKFASAPKVLFISICLFILSFIFSWTQNENITWGFQSQFFMAQILPLIAFYLLYKAAKEDSNGYFIAACLIGYSSSATMGNGILALPLMVLMAFFLRLSMLRIILLSFLALLAVFLYFYNYVSPTYHGSLSDALFKQPVDTIQYVLLYLGAPFYLVSGKGSHLLAQAAGLFLIFSSVYFAFKAFKGSSPQNADLILLAFLLFIGASALATAGGRVIFGIDQALTGRYMTPVLMGWIALLLLYADTIISLFKKYPKSVLVTVTLIQLLFLPLQFEAINKKDDTAFNRMMAALALELAINDANQINSIFPSSEWALDATKIPREKNLSIFSNPTIQDIQLRIGTKAQSVPERQCQGALDEVGVIAGDNNFIRLRGWIFDPSLKETPSNAFVVNEDHIIVGYVISGSRRPDVSAAIDPKAHLSGFGGYAISTVYSQQLQIVTGECFLPISISALTYTIEKANLGDEPEILPESAVADIGGWTGADFYKSSHEKLRVYGSFINSDQDTGSIKILATDKTKIYYRSGPSSKGQRIIVDGVENNLPVAIDWVILEIKLDAADTKEIILVDDGAEWGQWSAIALKRAD